MLFKDSIVPDMAQIGYTDMPGYGTNMPGESFIKRFSSQVILNMRTVLRENSCHLSPVEISEGVPVA